MKKRKIKKIVLSKNKTDDRIMKDNLLKKWDNIYTAHLDMIDKYRR